MCDDEEYYDDLMYSEDSFSEPDVDLENQYYNSKAMKEDFPEKAIQSFYKVIELEAGSKGEWGFKAWKQMLKLHLLSGNFDEMLNCYAQLLTYIKTAVTRNYSEKSINAILDRISTKKGASEELLELVYEKTLLALSQAKNDRLWFKTKTKLAKLYFDRSDFNKLIRIIRELHNSCQTVLLDDDDAKKGSQLLEIYALEIQLYTAQKNNKKLKALYEKTLSIKSAISAHPLTLALIGECGAKMYMRQGDYDQAYSLFFDAFKAYDESGASAEQRNCCLKYLLLASMLNQSRINPFDSQETKPYEHDSEIEAFTSLLQAYHYNDIKRFKDILTKHKDSIMADPFIREHIEDLFVHLRTKMLVAFVKAYSRISLSEISRYLMADLEDVELLLVLCILDEKIDAKINQIDGILEMQDDLSTNNETCGFNPEHLQAWSRAILNLQTNVIMNKIS